MECLGSVRASGDGPECVSAPHVGLLLLVQVRLPVELLGQAMQIGKRHQRPVEV